MYVLRNFLYVYRGRIKSTPTVGLRLTIPTCTTSGERRLRSIHSPTVRSIQDMESARTPLSSVALADQNQQKQVHFSPSLDSDIEREKSRRGHIRRKARKEAKRQRKMSNEEQAEQAFRWLRDFGNNEEIARLYDNERHFRHFLDDVLEQEGCVSFWKRLQKIPLKIPLCGPSGQKKNLDWDALNQFRRKHPVNDPQLKTFYRFVYVIMPTNSPPSERSSSDESSDVSLNPLAPAPQSVPHPIDQSSSSSSGGRADDERDS